MVLLLDAYHLGDPLFLTALARDLHARRTGLVVVHGSAEAGERALEAAGTWPEAEGGVWRVTTDAQAAAVERAARELNRRVVHECNEAGAAVVGFVASGRGLLRAEPGSPSTLRVGRTGWLTTLVGQGGVAVVASLVEAPDAAALHEADPAAAAAALARALGTAVVVLTTARADGLPGPDGAPAEALALDAALATGRLPDAGLVTRTVAGGAAVRAAAPAALRTPGLPAGTWIGAGRPPDGPGASA